MNIARDSLGIQYLSDIGNRFETLMVIVSYGNEIH